MTDLTDDEAMAAEYVLGTLDASERTAAETRRVRDPDFEALVAAWESRLTPLAAAAPPLVPSSDLFGRVLSRLPVERGFAGAADNVLILRQRLRIWRGVAGIASALAAALALWVVVRDNASGGPSQQTYVAVLQRGSDQPAFMVAFDLAHHRMSVTPLATDAPSGKSYELWMIGGGKGAVPQSIGVVDAHATMRPHLPSVDDGTLSSATYAITLEPQGGSPTGQPTSAPVFVGKPIDASL